MRTARSLTVCRSCSICPGGLACHARPPATHAPHHTCPPATQAPRPCMPPAMHAPHHTHPLAMHTPPTMYDPPRGQNHGRLWKYNLAPTSLRAVKIQLIQLIRQQKIRIKRLVRFELTTCWSSVRHRSHFSDGSRISQTGRDTNPWVWATTYYLAPLIHLYLHSHNLDHLLNRVTNCDKFHYCY